MRKRKQRAGGRLNSVTAVISATMVLVLVGTVVFFAAVADNFSRSLRENFAIEVMLNDSLTVQQTRALQRQIERQPYTKRLTYTSKEEATRQQREALDTDPEEFLGGSPIPASFELFLKADYANGDSLSKFMPPIAKNPAVLDVVYPKDLLDNVNDNIGKVSLALLVVAALLGMVSIALINNTMRLSVARRKHTIQTMKLVGARWSFIRRPFLLQAFWMGLLSSLLADGVLFAGMAALLRWDIEAAALVTPMVMGVTLVAVPVVGILLTLTCAFFSVSKHLGMSRNEAYLY